MEENDETYRKFPWKRIFTFFVDADIQRSERIFPSDLKVDSVDYGSWARPMNSGMDPAIF